MKTILKIITLFSITPFLIQGNLTAMNPEDLELFNEFLKYYPEKKEEILQNLKAGLGINTIHPNSCTLLQVAALKRNETVCCKLLEMGADPNRSDDEIKPPLIMALEQHLWQAARLMIQKGATVIGINGGSLETPVQIALEANQIDICLLLLSKGANPNRGFSFTTSPLETTIEKDDYRLCRALLSKGAIIKSRYQKIGAISFLPDEYTENPLFYAIKIKAPNACRAVLAHILFGQNAPTQADQIRRTALENKDRLRRELYIIKNWGIFNRWPIDMLNYYCVDETIEQLICEEIANAKKR